MTPENLENLYQEASQTALKTLDGLPSDMKMWVLFRIAMEHSAKSFGIEHTNYFMSRLLAETAGILAGDENAGYENVFKDFDKGLEHLDVDNGTKH